MARGEGPFQVLGRIGDNANKLEFPGDMNVSATFSKGDSASSMQDNFDDLRENPSQEGKVDAYQSPSQMLAIPLSTPMSLVKMVTALVFHFVSTWLITN